MKGGHRAKSIARALLRKRPARGWFVAVRPQGFTIIEVMIVLAVTGALFLSAVLLISGRQQQTEFNQSIREVRSQIQQAINEVSIGFYPSNSNFTCSVSGGGPPGFTTAPAGQGTNEGCIFLGKAIQFGVEDTDPEEFRVMTIAGRQQNSGGQPVGNLNEAQPRVVAPSIGSGGVPDVSSDEPLLYGLNTAWADAGVIAFVSTLSDAESAAAEGAQQLSVVPVDTTTLNMSPEVAAQAVNDNLPTSPQNPADGVQICFESGGTRQSGLITIGGSGQGLSVELDIRSNTDCSS